MYTFRFLLSLETTSIVPTAPEIMFSEVILIFFVLAIWLSAIGFCLSQYKSLRRLETQAYYCFSRKDPLNIGDIKIVTREQDSIIYKKKRYSTVLNTQINDNDLKAIQYVKEYLPGNVTKTTLSSTGPRTVIQENRHPNDMSLSTSVYSSPESLTSVSYTQFSSHNKPTKERHTSLAPTSYFLTETDILKPSDGIADTSQAGKSLFQHIVYTYMCSIQFCLLIQLRDTNFHSHKDFSIVNRNFVVMTKFDR